MRLVLLCSSPYSETGCAAAARLAQLGHIPLGALTLPATDRATLIRKLAQWGLRESLQFAAAKLSPGKSSTSQSSPSESSPSQSTANVSNPYLAPALHHDNKMFRSLHQVARHYRFPVLTVNDQNSPRALAQLKQWSSDALIFTGGNILRSDLLNLPRIGVLNAHLASLPEIRGMSSPEWSLLCGVPLAITIHLMDSGIDTGPILLRREFRVPENCDSLRDLRHRMIAAGIELLTEAVTALDQSAIAPTPQPETPPKTRFETKNDNQYFVMHQTLKAIAERRLKASTAKPASPTLDTFGGRDA